MKSIEIFKIDQNSQLDFLIPDDIEKFNYYYKPTDKLHIFDEITILYKEKNNNVFIFNDNLNEALISFGNILKKALNSELLLPEDIKVGDVGYHYNIDTNNDNDLIDYGNFWLWSTKGVQTWLYNKGNGIYIEISPSYPFFYSKEVGSSGGHSFADFMSDYSVLAIKKINEKVAKEWIEKCDQIMDFAKRE